MEQPKLSSYVHAEYDDGYKFVGIPGVVHGLITLHDPEVI